MPTDDLELTSSEQDRLERLVERRLPHLLDEPDRVAWYVAEVISYWRGRGGRQPKDWPLTIMNRMLRLEPDRFGGRMPNPAQVRHEQAERRLAHAAAKNAEQNATPAAADATDEVPLFRPREVD